MKKLEKLKDFKVEGQSSIWGGRDCNKYTQNIDYCKDAQGNCQTDEICWVCDDTGTASSTQSSK
ncbi:MAG: hypothetical protein KA215_03225 [Flavobacterium sp.]|nr:hypothetical protein [Flavobacterium sp.]